MIAVVGATGNTGRSVVKELRNWVRNRFASSRNPDKAREVLGAEREDGHCRTDRPDRA